MSHNRVESYHLSGEESTDYIEHLEAVAFLLYSALSDHLGGPVPCGSSRGMSAQARYERLKHNSLIPEDLETMAPFIPTTPAMPTLEQHLQARDS
jgi:hypothetical protein